MLVHVITKAKKRHNLWLKKLLSFSAQKMISFPFMKLKFCQW